MSPRAVVDDVAVRVEHEHVARRPAGAARRARCIADRVQVEVVQRVGQRLGELARPSLRRAGCSALGRQLVHRLAADVARPRAACARCRCSISADQRQHDQPAPAPSAARNRACRPEAQAHSTSARTRATPSRDAVQRVLRRRRRPAGSAVVPEEPQQRLARVGIVGGLEQHLAQARLDLRVQVAAHHFQRARVRRGSRG